MASVGYRSIATREVSLWSGAALANKLPIAMAPLACVFLVRDLPGGYALGASLAAVWVAAEVIGAPLLGLWFKPERAKAHLAMGLGLGAAAYLALSFGRSLPMPAVIAFTFLSGFGPAATPGGMRALLTRLVPEKDVPKVLSAEMVLNGLVWASAPPLVAFLALGTAPGVPFAVAAALDVVALSLVMTLPGDHRTAGASGTEHTGKSERPRAPSQVRILILAWPIYLTAAASMAMLSIMELVLPSLVEHRGMDVGTVAPLLTVFWIGSVVGGYVYGRRPWPGSVRRQSLLCLLATTVVLTSVAVLPEAVGMGFALAIGGMFQAVVLVTRNLSLRERLPDDLHTAGYAVMYAATGVGYSIVAAMSAMVLRAMPPTVAVVSGGALTLLIVAASGFAEREKRSPRSSLRPGSRSGPGSRSLRSAIRR